MRRLTILSAIFLIFQTGVYAQKSVLMNAMKDELRRSMEQLKLEGDPGPYYLSYQVDDSSLVGFASEFGAPMASADNRSRSVKIDLRVGSYSQDNSNFLSGTNISSLLSSSASARLPLDDDYYGLRRGLWMTTDRAYKTALDTLSKKKNYLQNVVQAESIPDFTKGNATSSLLAENPRTVDKARWSQLVDQTAKLFSGLPEIQRSRVVLTIQIVNSYYINSEGAEVIEPYSVARLDISASIQADDGMPLNANRSYVTRPDTLPDKAALEADVRKMISDLLASKTAPVAEQYSGPVLFVGQAAGELFNQGFAVFLSARRQPVTDNPSATRLRENPFLEKINTKVAANFLSVKAVPTMKTYGKQGLIGSCTVDEEGVPCQDVSLIENGILKNLLATRTPVKGFTQSNGHARGGGVAPSVIQISSTNKKPMAQLKQDLMNAAKEEGLPFGYIVYGVTPGAVGGGASATLSALLSRQDQAEPTMFRLANPYSIFRLYPDGKEEPVRGAEFGSIHINSLRNILATSDDETIHDFAIGSSHPATVITPSLLITGIDLKKSLGAGTYPKLPIVGPPDLK
jgi:predicted Zn-dependent protease